MAMMQCSIASHNTEEEEDKDKEDKNKEDKDKEEDDKDNDKDNDMAMMQCSIASHNTENNVWDLAFVKEQKRFHEEIKKMKIQDNEIWSY